MRVNPEQETAVTWGPGPVLLIAGPGTGKTSTLVERIRHLLETKRAKPSEILAVTLTPRAALEMRVRLAKLDPLQTPFIRVTTFHGFALQFLREYGAEIDLPSDFHVSPEAFEFEKIFCEPGAPCLRFDDLLTLAVNALEDIPALRETVRTRFPFLFVDEFQDLDSRQFRLIQQLVAAHGNVFAIGDPDQSIYGFRGASPEYFLRFQETFPTAKVISLQTNYRSTQTILDSAAQMLGEKTLRPHVKLKALNETAQRIVFWEAQNDRSESEFIVRRIETLLDATGIETDYTLGDFAILYRNEARAHTLEKVLQEKKLPYQKRSHEPLIEREGLRTLLSGQRQELGQSDPDAWLAQVLRAKHHSIDAETAEVLRSAVSRFTGDWEGLLNFFLWGTSADLYDPSADRIALLTLHAAKGLEFRSVFILGCEDDLLPYRSGPTLSPQEEDEERRLFYVGMTRAREELVLTRARSRPDKIKPSPRPETKRTRFVDSVAGSLLTLAQEPSDPARRSSFQMQIFAQRRE